MTEVNSEFIQVRSFEYTPEVTRRGCVVWCPGCASPHIFWLDGPGPIWVWDGNVDRPTMSPSYLVKGGSNQTVCHSWLREGEWQFLGDSTHSLAGETLSMVPLPSWLQREVKE